VCVGMYYYLFKIILGMSLQGTARLESWYHYSHPEHPLQYESYSAGLYPRLYRVHYQSLQEMLSNVLTPVLSLLDNIRHEFYGGEEELSELSLERSALDVLIESLARLKFALYEVLSDWHDSEETYMRYSDRTCVEVQGLEGLLSSLWNLCSSFQRHEHLLPRPSALTLYEPEMGYEGFKHAVVANQRPQRCVNAPSLERLGLYNNWVNLCDALEVHVGSLTVVIVARPVGAGTDLAGVSHLGLYCLKRYADWMLHQDDSDN